MLHILLPVLAREPQQIESRLGLWEICRRAGWPVGLEFFTLMDDLENPEIMSAAVRAVKKLPDDMVISLHAPIDWQPDSPRNYFSSPDPKTGFSYLTRVFDWADKLGASQVNLHAHRFYTYDQMLSIHSNGKIDEIRQHHFSRVKETLDRLRHGRNTNPIILIENVPYLLTDSETDPRRIGYEISFADLNDFFLVADPGKNILATVDTCHLAQLHDSSQLLSRMQNIGHMIGEVHLNDLGSVLQPFRSPVQEGIILGDGRIGMSVSRQLVEYVHSLSQERDISIVLEIREVDYYHPVNIEKTLHRVMGWLDDLSRRLA